MSKVNCEFTINFGIEEANNICRKALFNNVGLIASGSNNEYTIKETGVGVGNLFNTTNPATTTVSLKQLDDNTTKVFIETKNIGFGPVQNNYCKRLLSSTENLILAEADNRKLMTNNNSNNSQPSVIEQIKQLSDLRDSGILTSEEFENKKAELLSKI